MFHHPEKQILDATQSLLAIESQVSEHTTSEKMQEDTIQLIVWIAIERLGKGNTGGQPHFRIHERDRLEYAAVDAYTVEVRSRDNAGISASRSLRIWALVHGQSF